MKFSSAGIFLLLGGLFVTGGCSVFQPAGDYFGQRYVNTVSYFNTYYNANQLFNESISELNIFKREVRPETENGFTDIPPGTKEKFDGVIEKCSRLLYAYPASRYVEHCLSLIGKSYYYMNNNVQAERKFLELLVEYPDGKYRLETMLYLARVQKSLAKRDDAAVTLNLLIDELTETRHRDLLAEAYLEMGRLHLTAERIRDAVNSLEVASESARGRDLKLKALFQLASLLYATGDIEEAYQIFKEIVESRPPKNMLFQSQMKRVDIYSELERFEDSKRLLYEMKNDLQLEEYLPAIEYKIGTVYADMGLIDEAINQYTHIDTAYTMGEYSVKSNFALGQLYELIYRNYEKAKEQYVKGGGKSPRSELTEKAELRGKRLARYFQYKNDIKELDSLIARTESIITNKADTMMEKDTAYVLQDNSDTVMISREPDELRNELSAYRKNITEKMYELGNLFYIELSIPDSAFYWYHRIIHNYPESVYVPNALYAIADIVRIMPEDEVSQVVIYGNEIISHADVYHLIIEKYPKSIFAAEARRFLDIAGPQREVDTLEVVYGKAQDAILNNDYEKAEELFKFISESNADRSYIYRSYYALGWIYENVYKNQSLSAKYYRELVENFPDTEQAISIIPKLTAWENDSQSDGTFEQIDELDDDRSELNGQEKNDKDTLPE